MSDPRNPRPEEPETVSCDVCMKEIPADLAKSEEGTEYVFHFCGHECFGKWHLAAKKEKFKPVPAGK